MQQVVITKKTKIHEVNNSMCHNYYYLINGKLIKDNTFKRFKFIMWFDIFDLMEYFEKDSISQNDIKQYANELANSIIENQNIDFDNPEAFYDYCNKTIDEWNESCTR